MKLLRYSWLTPAYALYFSDCLHQPSFLSWTPNSVFADYSHETGLLHFSIQGSVSGSALTDLNETENKYTTLNVQARSMQGLFADNYTRFCEEVDGACPIEVGQMTVFGYSVEVPAKSRRLSDVETLFKIISPMDGDGEVVGCVSVLTSPVISKGSIYAVLFATLGVSICVFVATFGMQSLSSWTRLETDTNVGLKSSILSQFTDLISYWQFAFFVACLNLNYAGLYQALASGFGWAALTFGKSFTSDHVTEAQNGLYNLRKPGITAMATIVGLHEAQDIWPGFIIWFLVIFGATLLATVVSSGLAGKWSRKSVLLGVSKASITVIYSLLALPLLTFSFYQLQAGDTLTIAKVLSGLVIGVWASGAVLFTYFTSRDRKPDLHTLTGRLKPGTSTFRAAVLFVQLGHVFLLALCIGLLQSSGVAQIAFMGTLEFLYFAFTLIVSPFLFSKLNALVSLFRMTISLLSIVYIRSLDTSISLKMIMGVVILVLHLVVCLVFVIFSALLVFKPRFRTQSTPTTSASSSYKSPNTLQQYNDEYNEVGQAEKRAIIRESIRLPELTKQADLETFDFEKNDFDEKRLSQISVQERRHKRSLSKPLTIDTSYPSPNLPIPNLPNPNPPNPERINASPLSYYRPPRRRSDDHSSLTPATLTSDHVTLTPNEAHVTPDVDYTQREADIYKRSSTMCEDYDLGADIHKSTSHLLTKSKSHDHERRLWQPKTWLSKEDPLEPKGFEVVGRGL